MVFSHELVEEIKQMVDIDQLLSMLGFVPKHRSSKEIRGCCPIHHGDNPTAFRVNIERKTFACFSKGCHENGNDVITLVMKVFGYGFVDAVRYLASIAGVNVETFEVDPQKVEQREVRKYLSVEGKLEFYKSLSPSVPEDLARMYMLNRNDYYINRGFSEDILDYFEVGFAYDDFGTPRATIPIRDDTGRLISIVGRVTEERDDTEFMPKFKPMSEEFKFDKSKILYNMHLAKEAIKSTTSRSVIAVEGYSGVWNMVRHGFLNTVAVMGSMILEPQVYTLAKYCLTVYTMFDGDEAGRKGTVLSRKQLERGFKFNNLSVPEGKDPGDMNINEIKDSLINGGYYT